nr:sigma-70 family RNA polymerase sigma factor [Lysinibacillus timonensis]
MTCSEGNFIRYLKKRHEAALNFIVEEYGGLVHAISVHILSKMGQEAVDECINDVFLSVWQKADQFIGSTADFKKWIGMIAKYKAIDLYRQLEKKRAREQADSCITEFAYRGDIQTQLIQQEQKNELLLAMNELPEMDRDIFMMKYFLDMSSQEIGEQLNLSITAIDNRLYRGRKKLAQNKQLKERYT